DGRSFLVRDRRLVPYFFVRAGDSEAARALGAGRQTPVPLSTMRGDAVARVEVDTPDQTPPLREALQRAGFPVFEADVRFAMRYLIERGIRGGLEIEAAGAGRPARAAAGGAHPPFRVDVLFDDPVVRPAEHRPGPDLLRVLSIDLETDPRGEEIYSAAL